mgnify:CR=1 FL=1
MLIDRLHLNLILYYWSHLPCRAQHFRMDGDVKRLEDLADFTLEKLKLFT